MLSQLCFPSAVRGSSWLSHLWWSQVCCFRKLTHGEVLAHERTIECKQATAVAPQLPCLLHLTVAFTITWKNPAVWYTVSPAGHIGGRITHCTSTDHNKGPCPARETATKWFTIEDVLVQMSSTCFLLQKHDRNNWNHPTFYLTSHVQNKKGKWFLFIAIYHHLVD